MTQLRKHSIQYIDTFLVPTLFIQRLPRVGFEKRIDLRRRVIQRPEMLLKPVRVW